jgi:hypothetical protein
MRKNAETEKTREGELGGPDPVCPSLHRPISPSLRIAQTSSPAHTQPQAFSDAPGAGSNSIHPSELVPAEILDGGEIVILAVKPSLWFVVLKSARWLAGMIVAILLAHWMGDTSLPITEANIIQAAVVLAGARVGFALLQWGSRLYVLTNRRIMLYKGIVNIDLFECQLTKIQSTFLTLAWYERLMGIGTISFATAAGVGIDVAWTHVNNPLELHERVRSAIHRAQRPGNGI